MFLFKLISKGSIGRGNMVELLTTYNLSQILIFIVLLAGAFKAISNFLDWLKNKRKTDTLKDMKPEELEKQIKQESLEREQQISKMETKHLKDIENLQEQIGGVATQVSKLTDKIDLLIESDKDDIKAFITREYHYFCEQKGWIDDYSMDCIEKRYDHYVEEKGNSFIQQLMSALRALPRKPPRN